ncbi:hypothetical protein IQ07DRAFT_629082 [Pyrenochaeta sp. DS3sAY3a]|nr:hypothetical protein IQ07DRAFT_629082 [Pyrenochaeta sp. DS3sAY3a]
MATPTSSTLPSTTTSTSSPTCTTAIPDANGYVPPEACNAQWSYSPSFAAAVAFTVLFGLGTLAHILLAILHRKPFCWVIVMGATWEFVAFILRSIGSRDQQKQSYAIGSQLLFLLAPLWINAFVYMAVGRMVYMLHPEKRVWRIKAISLGKWFVWLDIVSFLVQAGGGLLLSPEYEPNVMDIGKKIYMSGVGVQQGFILLFTALIVRFHIDVQKLERQGLLPLSKAHGVRLWKWLTCTLYIVLALISMRIGFRLVEFAGGVEPGDNQLPFKEGYALGLDAFPMLTAVTLLAIMHPGLVLKGPESEFPSRKERKAEKKAKKQEKKMAKEDKKRMKKARKRGGSPFRASDERRITEDVELGYVR